MPVVRYVLRGDTALTIEDQLPRFVGGGATVLARIDPQTVDVDLVDVGQLPALDDYMRGLGFDSIPATGKQPPQDILFEIQTTDATPTVLGVWSQTTGSAGDLIRIWDAFIVGRTPSGTNGRLQLCHTVAVQRGVAGVLIASQVQVDQVWGAGAIVPVPECLVELGGQLVCRVTGAAGVTINWLCRASVLIDRA